MDDAGLGPKNTKPPTLEGLYRLYDYAGPAWYQRDIEIPSAWQGKRRGTAIALRLIGVLFVPVLFILAVCGNLSLRGRGGRYLLVGA